MINHNSKSRKRKMSDRREKEEEERMINDVIDKIGEELQQKMQREMQLLSASLLSKLTMDREEKRRNTGKHR